MATIEYEWDVFVPGADLPCRITTDYIVAVGELLSVDGASFLVEEIAMPADAESGTSGLVHVARPREPTV